MEQQANGSVRLRLGALAVAVSLLVGGTALGQRAAEEEEGGAPSTDIGVVTARILQEAIELLNMENYAGAGEKLNSLRLDRLAPYERGTVERILFSIAYNQERYDAARGHLQNAINSGGLNAQQIDEARYQIAQMYMQEENWREGAAALEEWFKTAANPNSAAYYMLSIAYYQMEDMGRSRTKAGSACCRRSICSARSIGRPFPFSSSSCLRLQARRRTGCSSRRCTVSWRTTAMRSL